MVDYAGYVTDEFLNEVLNDLSGEGGERYKKGDRVVCTPEQLGRVLNKIDSQNFKVTTGGSLSNTLVALSRLGGAEGKKGRGLRVGMAGLVGEDPIGSFYRAKMDRAGVEYLSQPTHKTTGTVVVLTTPDAQRTMLSHFPDDPEPEDGASPSSSSSVLTPRVVSSIVNSRVLLLEGYLLECGQKPWEHSYRRQPLMEPTYSLLIQAFPASTHSCIVGMERVTLLMTSPPYFHWA